MKEVKRFDFYKRPRRIAHFWKSIMWICSFPVLKKRKFKLEKVNMEGLKTPYLVLSNHHSFFDFMVLTRAIFPHRANYVVAIDAFYDFTEWLLRCIGSIGKRKFTNDISLIKNMKYAIDKRKRIVVLYPEARYSIDGSTSMLPESLGKVIKFLKVPVVVLNMRGTYIAQPQWNKTTRKVPFEATMTQVMTKEQVADFSVDEINDIVLDALQYNDFQYQKEKGLRITDMDRATHLNRILYQCPKCFTEHKMHGEGIELWCEECGKRYEFTELGEIRALDGITEYDNVHAWYTFEREFVRKQVYDGTYKIEDEAEVWTLPNTKQFYKHGIGKFKHDLDGFKLEVKAYDEEQTIVWEPLSTYSCHIEYNYKKNGDAIDLSTLDESYWIFPKNLRDAITKISLATEEIYKMKRQEVKSKTTK